MNNDKATFVTKHGQLTSTQYQQPQNVSPTSTEKVVKLVVTELHDSLPTSDDVVMTKATDLEDLDLKSRTRMVDIDINNENDDTDNINQFRPTTLQATNQYTESQQYPSSTTRSPQSPILMTTIHATVTQPQTSMLTTISADVSDSKGIQQPLEGEPIMEKDTLIHTSKEIERIVTTPLNTQVDNIIPTDGARETMSTFENHIPSLQTVTTESVRQSHHRGDVTQDSSQDIYASSKLVQSSIHPDSAGITLSTDKTERVVNVSHYRLVNEPEAASSHLDNSHDPEDVTNVNDSDEGVNPVRDIITPDTLTNTSSSVSSGKQQTDTKNIILQSKLPVSTKSPSRTLSSNVPIVTNNEMIANITDRERIPDTTSQPKHDEGDIEIVPIERLSHALLANQSTGMADIVHQNKRPDSAQNITGIESTNAPIGIGEGQIHIPENNAMPETTDLPGKPKLVIDTPVESPSDTLLANHSMDSIGIVQKDNAQKVTKNSENKQLTSASSYDVASSVQTTAQVYHKHEGLLVDQGGVHIGDYGDEDDGAHDIDDNDNTEYDDDKDVSQEKQDDRDDYNDDDEFQNQDVNKSQPEENEDQMSQFSIELVGGESDFTDWEDILQSSDYTQTVTDYTTPTRHTSTLSTKTSRPLLEGEEHGMYSEEKPRWKNLKLQLYPDGSLPVKPDRPTPLAKAENCMDGCSCLYNKGFTKNGVYSIPNPPLSGKRGRRFSVSCEMKKDGSAWTVIQRRVDASTNFFRPWDRYAHGFGVPGSNFWIGNNFLHALTRRFPYQLRVEFTDWKDKFGYAVYDKFEVLDQSRNYRLILGTYIKGNRGDALSYHNNTEFSTKDRDNDLLRNINCAELRQSGFWFKACNKANPNGRWIGTHEARGLKGGVITWGTWPHHGFTYALKSFKMMIRPVSEYVPS
ncbi:uncharacterized protein [Amphiura filiformis]|uniref:uncharacterized protein n=1 Tax=Amphiura filiformis TaxID=82378 RepID=UPI003B21C53F